MASTDNTKQREVDPTARPSAASDDEGASGALVIAAVLLGISALMSAYAVSISLDRNTDLIARVFHDADVGIRRGIQARTPSTPEEEDPSKRYTLNTAGSPSRGPESAKVTIVEFGDLQCPFCARATPTLRKIRKTYGDDVRIVFKHLPLPIHVRAAAAHVAAEAAHRQGKFWEMHDKMYADQLATTEEKYLEWAAEIGLDAAQFERDLIAPDVQARIDADMREAAEQGFESTPVFFINGQRLEGAKPFAEFAALIDGELGK